MLTFETEDKFDHCVATSLFNPNQSYQIVPPEVAKKFQKMTKTEFWQRNSPHLSNLAKNIPKLLQIGGKRAKNCSIFWRKIATSGNPNPNTQN